VRKIVDEIPRAWCPSCRSELRPIQVLLQRCPRCGVDLEEVLVDRRDAEKSGLL